MLMTHLLTSTAITSATQGVLYTYTITTSDDIGDVVTLSSSTIPSWLSFDVDTGILTGTEIVCRKSYNYN